jgi:hypothetical protein
MSDPDQIEIYRRFNDSQSRIRYFLLAAAGAAIGFAVTQTQGASLQWHQLPAGISVIFWGISIYCGRRAIEYTNSNHYASYDLIEVKEGRHPEVGQHPQMINAATVEMDQAMEKNSEISSRMHRWQFRSLLIGAFFFIVWHVLQMYIRSGSATPRCLL